MNIDDYWYLCFHWLKLEGQASPDISSTPRELKAAAERKGECVGGRRALPACLQGASARRGAKARGARKPRETVPAFNRGPSTSPGGSAWGRPQQRPETSLTVAQRGPSRSLMGRRPP
eukprot:scaffold781_cov394-Prasinococcus_capsulatus_cf.AAC.1